jgi:Bacterial PH domain
MSDGPSPVRTYRPVGAAVVSIVAGASLLAVMTVIALALPPDVQAAFTLVQDITLAVVMGSALAALYGIARTRVRTDESGIHVVNGFRRHDVSWTAALGVSLGRGAPWAVLDTNAGTTVQLMAIQRSDGDRALRAVRELRAGIARYGESE